MDEAEAAYVLGQAAGLIRRMSTLLEMQHAALRETHEALAESIAQVKQLQNDLMLSQSEIIRLSNELLGKDEDQS
jgi:hypothetical protein